MEEEITKMSDAIAGLSGVDDEEDTEKVIKN